MAYTQGDIDRIVRSVMARLAGTDDEPTKTAENDADQAGTVHLAEKVVSLEQLKGRIDAAGGIVVSASAVITPAARDLLRQRGMTVQRAAKQANRSPRHGSLIVGVADVQCDPAGLWKAIGQEGVQIEPPATGPVARVIEKITKQVDGNRELGLLLTGNPAAALCLANRRRGGRAALGIDVRSVAAAVDTIGANVLVIDPRGRSVCEMKRMIVEFVRGGPRECPDEWKQLLQ